MLTAIVNSLHSRLLSIVALATLPLAFLSAVILFGVAQSSRERLFGETLNTMRAVVTAVDGRMQMSVAALETLATDPLLADATLPAFRARAQDVLAARPFWATIALIGLDGRQRMNLAAPPGPLDAHAADPASLETVIRTAKPHIGGVAFGPIIREMSVAVRVPVLREGKVVAVLSAVIRPESLLEVTQQQPLPAQGLISVLDQDQRVVARTRNQQDWVGRSASDALVSLLAQGKTEGWGVSTTLEGDEVYTLYARSPSSGWVAAVGVPLAVVDRPVQLAYLSLLGAIVVSLGVGALLALLAARTVTRPLAQLEEAAAAVAQRRPPIVPDTSLPEIRNAGEVLGQAFQEREALLESEKQLRHQAERESKSKDEFLAMLGHELRNPLAGIVGAVMVLQRAGRLTPETRPMFDIIERQSRVLVRLTDDLLQVSRLLTWKVTLECRPVDLGALVANTVDTMKASGELQQHNLLLDTREAWVSGDEARLEQVVSNVVGNAVKYTPAGGTITVTVGVAAARALLKVRDTGIGIDSKLAPHVFDLFVQGDRSLDRSKGGLGLGLTLVRRLIELHQGTVVLHSDGQDRGTEVTVSLPCVAGPISTAASTATDAQGASEV